MYAARRAFRTVSVGNSFALRRVPLARGSCPGAACSSPGLARPLFSARPEGHDTPTGRRDGLPCGSHRAPARGPSDIGSGGGHLPRVPRPPRAGAVVPQRRHSLNLSRSESLGGVGPRCFRPRLQRLPHGARRVPARGDQRRQLPRVRRGADRNVRDLPRGPGQEVRGRCPLRDAAGGQPQGGRLHGLPRPARGETPHRSGAGDAPARGPHRRPAHVRALPRGDLRPVPGERARSRALRGRQSRRSHLHRLPRRPPDLRPAHRTLPRELAEDLRRLPHRRRQDGALRPLHVRAQDVRGRLPRLDGHALPEDAARPGDEQAGLLRLPWRSRHPAHRRSREGDQDQGQPAAHLPAVPPRRHRQLPGRVDEPLRPRSREGAARVLGGLVLPDPDTGHARRHAALRRRRLRPSPERPQALGAERRTPARRSGTTETPS